MQDFYNASTSVADQAEGERSRLIGDEEILLTKTYLEVGLEKTEIDFLKLNSDVKHMWSKLIFNNGLKPYLLVFSPLNKTYEKDWSRDKGLDTARKWLLDYWGIKQGFGTTEILDCAKVHHNFVVWHSDLKALFDSYPNWDEKHECIIVKNKWAVHLTTINYLTSTYAYITKECKKRLFSKFKDFISFSKFTGMEKDNFIKSRKKPLVRVESI